MFAVYNLLATTESNYFVDESITLNQSGQGAIYTSYKIKAVDFSDQASNFSNSCLIQYSAPNSYENKDKVNPSIRLIPKKLILSDNYPNPFNPVTRIAFDLPETKVIQLNIYDITGQKVSTLVNKSLDAGFYKIVWNGTNASGAKVSSGIYLYELVAGDIRVVKKMFLAK